MKKLKKIQIYNIKIKYDVDIDQLCKKKLNMYLLR